MNHCSHVGKIIFRSSHIFVSFSCGFSVGAYNLKYTLRRSLQVIIGSFIFLKTSWASNPSTVNLVVESYFRHWQRKYLKFGETVLRIYIRQSNYVLNYLSCKIYVFFFDHKCCNFSRKYKECKKQQNYSLDC